MWWFLSSAAKLMDCPFSRFFWILNVTFSFFGVTWVPSSKSSVVISRPFSLKKLQSVGIKALITLLPDAYSYASTWLWVVWTYFATLKPNTLPTASQSNVTGIAELGSESQVRFAISTNISFVMGLLRLAIVSSRSCACNNFEVMFSLSECAGMRSPQYSKSLLILWIHPSTVLDLGLQSMIKFSTK